MRCLPRAHRVPGLWPRCAFCLAHLKCSPSTISSACPDPSSPLCLLPIPGSECLAMLVPDGPSKATHNENGNCDHTDRRGQLPLDPVQLQLFTPSFSKHFLRTYRVPGPVLGAGNATGTNIPVLQGLTLTWGTWTVTLIIAETRRLSSSDKCVCGSGEWRRD